MFDDLSKAWNGLTEGLSCTVAVSAKRDELNINDAGEVLSDQELNEVNLTPEELLQRFVSEACHVKDTALTDVGTDEAVAVVTRWARRLSNESSSQKTLVALLQSRALEILLLALTKSESGRLAISVASGIEDEGEHVRCSHSMSAPPLRSILARCSDAPTSLVSQLLSHLAEISDKSASYQGDGINPFAGDVAWSLLLMSAITSDASEVPVRKSAAYREEIEKSMEEVVEWAKATAPTIPGGGEQISVGTDVWAEWPFNGHWYRAEVKAVESEKIEVRWVERPENVIGGHEDDYLIAVVGDFYNYDQFTSILRVAAIPSDQERPAPAKELEDAGWSRQLEAAEKLTEKFHKLRALYEELAEGTKNKKEMKKVADNEKKCSEASLKILRASSETLGAMREDGERRLQAAQGRGSASMLGQAVELAREVEELIAKRLQMAHDLDGARQAITSRSDKIAAACLEAERLRGRMLEELLSGLHAALYGEDAHELVQDTVTAGSVNEIISRARNLSDQAYKEAVQFAAETLDGPLAAGNLDMSRSAKRYREMRPELKKNLDRLATLERNAPMVPPTPKKKKEPVPPAKSKLETGDAKTRPSTKKKEEDFCPDVPVAKPQPEVKQAPLATQPLRGSGFAAGPPAAAKEVEVKDDWAAFPDDFKSAVSSAPLAVPVQAPAVSGTAAPVALVAPAAPAPPVATIEAAVALPNTSPAPSSAADKVVLAAAPVATATAKPQAREVELQPARKSENVGCAAILGKLSSGCCGAA
mmetsp:Transcript_70892/g.125263  ORF Transcript_70892/g.125263 Transcript_70892/m.125263 type:complete len:763 (+) Transcript_70892:62-2350(+)